MSIFSGLEHIVREHEPLAGYTWFRLGGAAEYFAEPTNQQELAELVKRSRAASLPVRILGGGSNVLVRDTGVPGLVVHLTAPTFSALSFEGNRVVAGGGAKLGHVISAAVREGLGGLEPLVGIPGSIGGALHGNASSHECDIGQWTRSAIVMTHEGDIQERGPKELRFAYRQSSLDELVILSATFELERESSAELTRQMQQLWIVKKANQPMSDTCAGHIFKDAPGASAAELIEQADLRGAQVGGVAVSERNANFFVARAGAKSSDVMELIEHVKSTVQERLGERLELALDIW